MDSQLDLFTAETNKANGMNVAELNAEASHPGWSDMALEKLALFLYHNGNRPFMAEQVRVFAEKTGLPTAPNSRAWGPVLLRAARAGMVKALGYAVTSNPLAHQTPARLWSKA